MVSLLLGCSIPAGSKKGAIETVGDNQDGRKIISEVVDHYSIYPVSPEGFFWRNYWRYIYYYEQNENRKTKLIFLTYDGSDYELLKPILPVANSDKWVAFRLRCVARDRVDLSMYVFDNKKIHQTFIIHDAVRITVKGWTDISSYSISQSETNGTITINTSDGLIIYDHDSERLMIQSFKEM